MQKETKRTIIQFIIYFVIYIVILLVLCFIPGFANKVKTIMSRVGAEIWTPLDPMDWLFMFLYRLLFYFGLPIFFSIIESFYKKDMLKRKIWFSNFEASFSSLAFLTAILNLFCVDIWAESTILSLQDSMMFLSAFLLAIVFDKKFGTLKMEKVEDQYENN